MGLRNSDISDLDGLLINCQYLIGLYIIGVELYEADWNSLFKLLLKLSPANLFKFKFTTFYLMRTIKWVSIKLFLDNWKGRHPMLLQTTSNIEYKTNEYIYKGTVKKHLYIESEDFEW